MSATTRTLASTMCRTMRMHGSRVPQEAMTQL